MNRDSSVQIISGVLNEAQIRCLRAAMATGTQHPASVLTDKGEQISERHRRTKSVVLDDACVDLVGRRVDELRPEVEDFFMLRLGEREPLQFLKYSKGDFFTAHRDNASNPMQEQYLQKRVLTLVLFLSNQDGTECADCAGGLLTFFNTSRLATWSTCRQHVRVSAGTAVVFPSALLHEVTPIRQGERFTAVTWFAAEA